MGLRLAGEVNDDRAVEIFLKIGEHELKIFFVGLNQVNGSDAVELLAGLLDVEVKRDVGLPEILHLEERGVDLSVELIEDEHLPKILALVVNLLEETSLLSDEIRSACLHLIRRVLYLCDRLPKQQAST